MNKKNIDDNIFIIENFISDEDIAFFLKSMNDDDQIKDVVTGSGPHQSFEFYHNSDSDLLWKNKYVPIIKSVIDDNEFFNNSESAFSIIKYKTHAVYMDEHGHTGHEDWLMPPHKDVYDDSVPLTKGFVIYLTDNLIGGEIVYVNKNISVFPKAGSLLMHPGNEEYSHGVRHFTSGDRIVISGFIHSKSPD